MEINSDIELRGESWENVMKKLKDVFPKIENWDVFILALSIGIKKDESLEIKDYIVGRTAFRSYYKYRYIMDELFKAAILGTTTRELTSEERLKIAFEDDGNFDAKNFLLGFANAGVKELEKNILDGTDMEIMINFLDYLEE